MLSLQERERRYSGCGMTSSLTGGHARVFVISGAALNTVASYLKDIAMVNRVEITPEAAKLVQKLRAQHGPLPVRRLLRWLRADVLSRRRFPDRPARCVPDRR